MQVSKYLIPGCILLCAVSCVDPFTPDIDESADVLVVNGTITDQAGDQYVEVSRSAPLDDPELIPVEGCVVYVEDGEGNTVTYTEEGDGSYKASPDASFLAINKCYRLHVLTPDGNEYLSEYDSLLACPDIDSVYYEVEIQETDDPEVSYNGVQFYLDVTGSEEESGNFIWKLEETYEYRSLYNIQYVWNGSELVQDANYDSLYTCYYIADIDELYAATTRYLSTNQLNRYPLTYVSDQTVRLRIKYGLLVNQYSLSNEAFLYWEKMEDQMNNSGGLYETQPSSTIGNICNINDDSEVVLGYFYASQVKQKRAFVKKEELAFTVANYTCSVDTANSESEFGSGTYYVMSIAEIGMGAPYVYAETNSMCFDCRIRGGVSTKPEYW